jgi:NADH:ubiquinone oxidoreductase subunit 4 (subunit M)
MIAALVLVPIVAGLLVYLVPRSADAFARWFGVLIAFA